MTKITGIDLVTAQSMIFGSSILTPTEASKFWGVKASKPATENLRYNFRTMRFCSRRLFFNDWRIVYALPLSFREQLNILKKKKIKQKNLDIFEHLWWSRKDRESFWVDSKPEEGYYLIDIYPRFQSSNWHHQQEKVQSLGSKFDRADERVYTQLILTAANIYGLGYPQRISHWGHITTFGGFKINVLGRIINRRPCIQIHGASHEIGDIEIGTCVTRKWDF
jgi:hypothetical protein